MAKIAEVVKLKSGYANFVELKSAFEASQENADQNGVVPDEQVEFSQNSIKIRPQ